MKIDEGGPKHFTEKRKNSVCEERYMSYAVVKKRRETLDLIPSYYVPQDLRPRKAKLQSMINV